MFLKGKGGTNWNSAQRCLTVLTCPLPGGKIPNLYINLLKPYVQRAEVLNISIRENCKFQISERDLEIPYPTSDLNEYDFKNVVGASELGEVFALSNRGNVSKE